MMKHKNHKLLTLLFAASVSFTSCQAQEPGKQFLTLEKVIALPNVKGRIDHIDINLKDQVAYVAALGNNTLEIVDLKSGKVAGNISGLDEPQGVAYIAKHEELFVANGGTGECNFYNAKTLAKTGSVKFNDDADDVRYDADADKIYVGYGTGGIGIIDGANHKLIGDIKLPAHPESFQLNPKTGKLWVNLPGSGMIGVIDVNKGQLVDKWEKLMPRANFPMAYDGSQNRVIVGYRIPAALKVLDGNTGKELFSSGMAGDSDDLYWDEKSKKIIVSGGSGSINIFQQTAANTYKQVSKIPTRDGARTSLWVPELRMFILAARATGSNKAALLVYKIMN